MKKISACTAIVIVAAILGIAATQPRQHWQRDVLILQADQIVYYMNDGLGHTAWVKSEFFVVKAHGSSGAPSYPTYTYGDVRNVSGRTNTIIPLAQALADLKADGWRLVGVAGETYGGGTYTLERP